MRTPFLRAFVLVISVAALISGCSQNAGDNLASGPVEQDDFIYSAPMGAKPSTYGNCLSMPVIFAEGYGLTGSPANVATGLRGTPGVEAFVEPYDETTFIDGFPVYRNPSINEWQADWSVGSDWGGSVPVELDWSDNLTRNTWNVRSKVRVEVILTTPIDAGSLALQGYNMYSLGGTQLDEVVVTNTTKYLATSATVYSNVARLRIDKLAGPGGSVLATTYNSVCYEGYFVDGPTNAYTAEVNMGGKCIYGFNWDVQASTILEKDGWYRLTFSLDPSADYVDVDGVAHSYTRNTLITSLNPADVAGATEPDVVLYPATLSPDGYASILEVYVLPKERGRR